MWLYRRLLHCFKTGLGTVPGGIRALKDGSKKELKTGLKTQGDIESISFASIVGQNPSNRKHVL